MRIPSVYLAAEAPASAVLSHLLRFLLAKTIVIMRTPPTAAFRHGWGCAPDNTADHNGLNG
jgi:hypothetical protein